MNGEIWDVYDADRAKTGRTMRRGEAPPSGALHLVVHVCLFNPEGKMLVQRRQTTKRAWPGMWDVSVAGCALRGESSREAAAREAWEELGLRLELREARPAMTVNFSRGFDDIYLLEHAVDLGDLRLQAEEVAEVGWASEAEILEKIGRGEFIPYRAHLLGLMFSMRGRMGAIEGVWPKEPARGALPEA